MYQQWLVVAGLLAIGGCTQATGSLFPAGPSELPLSLGPLQPMPDVVDLSDTGPCHWTIREPDTCETDANQEPPVSTTMPIVEEGQPPYRFEPL